jgi:hypothetical protein
MALSPLSTVNSGGNNLSVVVSSSKSAKKVVSNKGLPGLASVSGKATCISGKSFGKTHDSSRSHDYDGYPVVSEYGVSDGREESITQQRPSRLSSRLSSRFFSIFTG